MLTALALNCTLKPSPEASSTDVLLGEVKLGRVGAPIGQEGDISRVTLALVAGIGETRLGLHVEDVAVEGIEAGNVACAQVNVMEFDLHSRLLVVSSLFPPAR